MVLYELQTTGNGIRRESGSDPQKIIKKGKRRFAFRVVRMSISAEGSIKRTVAVRLTPGEDLFRGIEAVCEKYGVRSGTILGGIGSFTQARVCDIVLDPGSKTGYGYGAPLEENEPIELFAISGSICRDEDDKVSVHAHCAFSRKDGSTVGGHLVEGCRVFITAEIYIAEFEGFSIERKLDNELGFMIAAPVQK